MGRKEFIAGPGEGDPVSWKAAVNHPEERQFVVDQAAADATVHLVDDSGRPISAQQAVELKRSIDHKTAREHKRIKHKLEKAARKVEMREQVRVQRKADAKRSRRSTISVGLFFWTVVLIAGIAGHVSTGGIVVWVLLSPLWVILLGLFGRMFLYFLRY
jgi:hypothetical protein